MSRSIYYRAVAIALCLASWARVAAGGDWPTWRHDAARSGSTPEELPTSLTLHWRLRLAAPQSCWPADQAKLRFDASYAPVVAGGRLFVPSMVEDCVSAYDLVTGARLWRFDTDGPVRFAPLVHEGKVFFVSDDGHLYAVDPEHGSLLWKFRGGPADNKVLGNKRLVSMWPARGAPVAAGNVVFFAAGIWPFMGVFVHALDARTGEVVWTNSGTGSSYVVQPHSSPAFAGVAPQGYLTLSHDALLVAGGNSVPAAFDRATGRLLYYRPGDRVLGKDAGGHTVSACGDWFSVGGKIFRAQDGESLVTRPAEIFSADEVYCTTKNQLSALSTAIERKEEVSVDKQGKEKKSVTYRLPERFRADLPKGVARLHVKAADHVLASDGDSQVYLCRIPRAAGQSCEVDWQGRVNGPIWDMLVADRRLLVVDTQGEITCFGPSDAVPASQQVWDETVTSSIVVDGSAREWASEVLALGSATGGYAVLEQVGDAGRVAALTNLSELQVLVLERDEARCAALRRTLRDWGLLGRRVAVMRGDLASAVLPPYLAELIVVPDAAAQRNQGDSLLEKAWYSLRPYGGTVILGGPRSERDLLAAAFDKWGSTGQRESTDCYLVLKRPGPLPGAGAWTHQTGNAANTLVSADRRVKTPLGLLWFGGESNQDVLPRHGHGPTPQVLGGRLFLEGRDMLRALDVFTGRRLWQRSFKDVGAFYDNTAHHPGANAIGGNFVVTEDSIYLVWGRRCLRLDPSTGRTLAEFRLPPDESGDEPFWGYLAVCDDVLVAGSSPVLLLSGPPGSASEEKEKEKDNDKEKEKEPPPLFSPHGEGSRRIVGMDRQTGRVLWFRDAQYNFRHNAIAVGNDRVFCLDRMTEQRLAFLRRRGVNTDAVFSLDALDLRTGEVLWQSTEQTFGTWLSYSSERKLVIQAGSRYRDRAEDEVGRGLSAHDALTGKLVWHQDVEYGGPVLLYPDMIVSQGKAFNLTDGRPVTRRHPVTDEPIPWEFTRNYGCGTAIGCVNLLTFRSAAAGYFDLADHGTGNLGGFRSGCTANLIPADGVLNAPDYTRTCTCSYQNQASLALIHMPDAEMWTFQASDSSGKRVKRLGVNFGAPGDRTDEDGTLWLDHPSVGGSSPDVPITVRGDGVSYFREHMSAAEPSPWPWVFASGVRGAQAVRIRLASREEAGVVPARYRVRLFLRSAADGRSALPDSAIRVRGHDEAETAGPPRVQRFGGNCEVREFESVAVNEFLEITFPATGPPGTESFPVVCGVEVVQQP